MKILPCTVLFLLAFLLGNCSRSPLQLEKSPVRPIEGVLPEYFIQEPQYADHMQSIVLPYLEQHSSSGSFPGLGGVEIAYRISTPETPKASIVLLHGWTESLRALNEVTYYFLKNNYAVYALDLRNHGYSGRTGIHPDQTDVIESFDEYVQDLKIFMDTIVSKSAGKELPLLYAHSLGGTVGGLFLQDYPGYFRAAVLSTPMTEMNTGGFPRFLANGIAWLGMKLGKAREFCPGQGPFDPNYDVRKGYTTSLTRFTYYYQSKQKDPKLQAWGASFRWFYFGNEATQKLIAEERKDRIKIPTLLFQAGDDGLIEYETGDQFASGIPERKIVTLPGAKHLVYIERDSILFPYMTEILAFFKPFQSQD